MICPNCHREIANYSNFCYFCGSRQPPAAATSQPRRLQRSLYDSKIAGVCGGIAEYLDVDPTIVRLVWAILTFCTAIVPGIVAYAVAWLIMPPGPIPVPVQPMAPPVAVQTPHAPQT
jgi:phage shock protein C